QELAQLRAELSNQAIGSKDHLRKIALSLVDKLEKCRDREIRWLALSDEKSKIITDQEEALEKAQQRITQLEYRAVKLPKRHSMLLREDFNEDYHTEMAFKAEEVQASLDSAGIKVEAE
ncbi:TPA: hypothetical protein ACK1S5_005740, partial [Klebsiella pneumoniae]